MRKLLKRLGGDILYRLKRKGRTSVHRVRHHPAFADLGPGDVAIDGGANLGLVTEVLAANGAEVHAFEPNPDAFRVLSERFGDAPHVHLYPQALLDEPGTMTLYLHLNYDRDPERLSQGSSLISEKRNVSETRGVAVEVVDLAAFIERLGKPVKVLKLDVEGAEYRILTRLIESGTIDRIGRVLVETHAKAIPSLRPADASLRRRIEEAGLAGKIDLNWI